MVRIQSPLTEVETLVAALRPIAGIRLRARAQIVLMAHWGWPHGQISWDTGTSLNPIQGWLNAYTERGLDALWPRQPVKARPKLTADLAAVLGRRALEGPQARELDRSNWTYADLAGHLYRTHGSRAGKSAMQASCRKRDISHDRPNYRFLRGGPKNQAAAFGGLAELKWGMKRVRWRCRARPRPASRWCRRCAVTPDSVSCRAGAELKNGEHVRKGVIARIHPAGVRAPRAAASTTGTRPTIKPDAWRALATLQGSEHVLGGVL